MTSFPSGTRTAGRAGTAGRTGAALAVAGLGALALPAPAAAEPTPSPGATPVTRSGTSFLTAAGIAAGQPVRVGASIGDYLYWSFPAAAGERDEITATVSFPKPRSGAATWTVEVFDGLRRRQPCTAGTQTPTVDATAASVSLGCTLRQVRSWAEPWSADPLPGTYYLRLSVADLPEADLGLPVEVELLVTADGQGSRDDGELKAPLVPNTRAGAVLDSEPVPAAAEDTDGGYLGWLPDLGSRWIWSAAGGVLAAVAGVVGFGLTRRPRRP
ncbi:peptidase [Plantactinospora sp. KBS50]|uniref:peptidase n=1 Tax=Plantactinospora sp. KBS50 TaxID=2024580 RepID=UPI000BAB1D9F|nr:peptidase [Plantactinospora sp. KBS50]ASW56527.1 peptidase [Plantactinospora sp. KBS50]